MAPKKTIINYMRMTIGRIESFDLKSIESEYIIVKKVYLEISIYQCIVNWIVSLCCYKSRNNHVRWKWGFNSVLYRRSCSIFLTGSYMGKGFASSVSSVLFTIREYLPVPRLRNLIVLIFFRIHQKNRYHPRLKDSTVNIIMRATVIVYVMEFWITGDLCRSHMTGHDLHWKIRYLPGLCRILARNNKITRSKFPKVQMSRSILHRGVITFLHSGVRSFLHCSRRFLHGKVSSSLHLLTACSVR